MSKIVFFCIPAHGHTNPTLGVVRELVSRGHQVWYYSYNIMREKIESAGATFISCDDYDMEQKLPEMNAHDRRIIHLALKEDPEVMTESEGEGAMRQVVISLKKQNEE